jgi:hypothetical protein
MPLVKSDTASKAAATLIFISLKKKKAPKQTKPQIIRISIFYRWALILLEEYLIVHQYSGHRHCLNRAMWILAYHSCVVPIGSVTFSMPSCF